VHKRAKADHAHTCQLLEDSQAAVDDARRLHREALDKAKSMEARLAAELQGKAQRAAVAEFAKQRGAEVEALRKQHGL
jgi:hypothetical protein